MARPLTIPDDVFSLEDYERRARQIIDPRAAAFLFGGSADEITKERNRAAFDSIALVPRVLRDLRGGNTALSILGRDLSAPVLLAPIAYQRLFHDEGEIASATAAAAMGIGLILSTLASMEMEHVSAAGEGAVQWFQLYFQRRREDTLTLVRRAEQAGFTAIVVTVDAPINGIRNREMHARFALPQGISAVNIAGLATSAPPLEGHPVFDGLMACAPTWHDLEWLRSQTDLPLVVKGILHPQDAKFAMECGANGLVVSNHGGRTLDTAVPTITALPAIVQEVRGRMPVLLDGGIRRGTDVLKSLALGATAVLLGRPYVCALAVAGAHGVAHVIRILSDEIAVAMALSGFRVPSDISSDIIER